MKYLMDERFVNVRIIQPISQQAIEAVTGETFGDDEDMVVESHEMEGTKFTTYDDSMFEDVPEETDGPVTMSDEHWHIVETLNDLTVYFDMDDDNGTTEIEVEIYNLNEELINEGLNPNVDQLEVVAGWKDFKDVVFRGEVVGIETEMEGLDHKTVLLGRCGDLSEYLGYTTFDEGTPTEGAFRSLLEMHPTNWKILKIDVDGHILEDDWVVDLSQIEAEIEDKLTEISAKKQFPADAFIPAYISHEFGHMYELTTTAKNEIGITKRGEPLHTSIYTLDYDSGLLEASVSMEEEDIQGTSEEGMKETLKNKRDVGNLEFKTLMLPDLVTGTPIKIPEHGDKGIYMTTKVEHSSDANDHVTEFTVREITEDDQLYYREVEEDDDEEEEGIKVYDAGNSKPRPV